YTSLYGQDTYTSGRLTLQGGLRWDLQKTENKPTTASANPMFPELLPNLVYDGSGTKISWSNISPPAGLSDALDQTRRPILRANFSIVTQQLAMPDATFVNPIGGKGRLEYGWNDVNHDGFVQKDEVNVAGGTVGVPQNITLRTVNQIDTNYKAPRDLEVLGGL